MFLRGFGVGAAWKTGTAQERGGGFPCQASLFLVFIF